jgi:hypothetical protein
MYASTDTRLWRKEDEILFPNPEYRTLLKKLLLIRLLLLIVISITSHSSLKLIVINGNLSIDFQYIGVICIFILCVAIYLLETLTWQRVDINATSLRRSIPSESHDIDEL